MVQSVHMNESRCMITFLCDAYARNANSVKVYQQCVRPRTGHKDVSSTTRRMRASLASGRNSFVVLRAAIPRADDEGEATKLTEMIELQHE